jgi:dTDP-4-dehydrorhamnose 3,5-epimerase-like enzyme
MNINELPIIVFSPITGLFEVCDSDVRLLHSLEQVEIVYGFKVGVIAASHVVVCGGETYCLSVEGQAQDVVSKFKEGERHLLTRHTVWMNGGNPRHLLVADPVPHVTKQLTDQEQLERENMWEDSCMACDYDWVNTGLEDE